MSQTQTNKPSAPAERAPEKAPKKPKDLTNEELAKTTDELMDKIDEVLEEDCQTFVANYVQRGGQ